MPLPNRRQNKVPTAHLDPLTLYSRKPSVALNDKPHRERKVSVCRGCLTGEDELEARVEGVGRVWRFCSLVTDHLLQRSDPTSTPNRGTG